MRVVLKISVGALVCILSVISRLALGVAQEPIQAPSEKTKEAVKKLAKTPSTIGKSFEALTEAANEKLKRVFGDKPEIKTKAKSGNLTLPARRMSEEETPRYTSKGKRDPFRPINLQTKTSARPRANLAPLERFELSQLKLVGIVWNLQEPRAMIEDSAGLGYIVIIGTPLGRNEGKVKTIDRNRLVVEETFEDSSGAKKKRDVIMKLPGE
jgi:Tfp pilus assembly protein PilP